VCGKIKAAENASCILCRCFYALFPGASGPGLLGKPCMTVPGMTTTDHGTNGPAAVHGNVAVHGVCSFWNLALLYAPHGPASIVILDKMRVLFSPHTAVQGPAGRLHPLDGEQLLHGDEFHPLLRQTVDGLQGRLHAGSVAVVQQDHIPVPRLTDGGEHLLYIPTLPVAGIHRPAWACSMPPAPPR